MFLQENYNVNGWTIPAQTYYVANPSFKERIFIRCVIPTIAVPFVTLSSVFASVILLQEYAPIMNTLWTNVLTGTAILLIATFLWHRYNVYRARLIKSGRVIRVKQYATERGTLRYASDDIRWQYLMGMAQDNEHNLLTKTPRGNALLDDFLCNTPVEANWHPEIDQDLIFQNATQALLQVRRTVGTT